MLAIPNLIQRAEIRHQTLPEQSSLAKELQMDFMGPHEYTINGVISLKNIHNHFSEYRTEKLLIPHDSQKLCLFHRLNDDEMSRYTTYLFDLRIGRIKAKVRTHFEICKPEDKRGTDFWWDLENHTMWSFNEAFMVKLPSYLTGEFQRMDEIRARRQLGGLA